MNQMITQKPKEVGQQLAGIAAIAQASPNVAAPNAAPNSTPATPHDADANFLLDLIPHAADNHMPYEGPDARPSDQPATGLLGRILRIGRPVDTASSTNAATSNDIIDPTLDNEVGIGTIEATADMVYTQGVLGAGSTLAAPSPPAAPATPLEQTPGQRASALSARQQIDAILGKPDQLSQDDLGLAA
jgi:hypothetical protein